MGFDVVDYIKKKKQQEDNKKENETEITGQNRFDVAEYSKYKNAENVANSINERLQTWFKNNDVFMQNHTDRYQGRTGTYNDRYASDASKWLETITNQKNNFDLEAKSIISLMDEYSDFLDADYVKKAKEYLTSAQGYQNDILKASSADVDYWSQWKDKDTYKEWQGQQKQNEEWASVDIATERSKYDRDFKNLNEAKGWQERIESEEHRLSQAEYNMKLSGGIIDEEEAKSLEQLKADLRNSKAWLMSLTLGKGVDEFESYLSEKNAYLTQAERYQKSVELASVVNAPDFEEYAQQGEALGVDPKGFKKAENQVAYLRNTPGELEKYKKNAEDAGNEIITTNTLLDQMPYKAAAYMTNDEFKIYNYYFAKDPKKAEQYLESIEKSLNSRQAAGIVAEKGDNDFAKMIFGVEAGLDSFRSGVSALLENDDYYVPSAVQMAGQQFREDLGESNVKLPDWLGGASLGQSTYDLLNTGANMAPSILASIGANLLLPGSGAVVSNVLMGASAGGNAYAEMINAGYTKEQAKTYGKLVAASESLLQYALGGVSALGGKLTGGAITNMLSKIDKAYIRVGLSTIGKMASEGLEEGLQSVLEPWFKSVATNTDFEAADIDEVLYSGLLGALSAGFLDNVNIKDSNTVVGATANAINNYKSNVAVGKQISGVDGALDRLLELGSVQSADSVAYKVAEKINKRLADGKKVGAYTIAKLFNAEGAALTEANVADITKSLTRKGVTESDAKTISAWMAKAVEGVPLTEAQANALENNPLLDRTFQDVIINPNSTVYQRTKQMSDFASDVSRGEMTQNKAVTATPATDTAKAVDTTESATTQEDATESKFKASVDGKTVLTETAEEVKPVGIESIKNGSVKVKLEDGKVVDASELAFATSDEAVLYGMVSKMDISPESAMALIKNFKATDGVSAERYAIDAPLAYKYGTINYAKGLENLTDLTTSQRQTAYYIGQNAASAQVKAQQAAISSGESVGGKGTTGRVSFEQGAYAKTREEKRAVKLAQYLSKAVGIDIVFYDATTKAEGENGYRANGYFNEKTNAIYLDLQRSHDDTKTIAFTMSHELTHFIKKWSPEKFKGFADFLMEQYGDTDITLESKMEQLGTKDAVLAYEELIADACETMLLDSNAAVKLMQLRESDLDLFEKIKLHVLELVNKIRTAYKNLGREATTDEAQALLKMEGVLEKLSTMFEDAAVDAAKNYQGKSDTASATSEEGVKMQVKSTKDGKLVAVVDNDILSGIYTGTWDKATSKKAKKAAKTALLKFKDGIAVKGITAKVNHVSRREYTRSNSSEALRRNDPNAYADKLRAAAVADDVVIATTNWKRDGGLTHPRKDDFVDFDKGQTLIMSGTNKYVAEVIIGITNKGEFVFYDVEDMNPTQFDIKNEGDLPTVTPDKPFDDILKDSNEDIITQAKPIVKNQMKKDSQGNKLSEEQYDFNKPITVHDVEVLRSIGRKSINEFTSEEIKKAQKWAYKFYKELGTKSPFFRAWFGEWRAQDKSQRNIVSVSTIDVSQVKLATGDYKIDDTGWTVYAGKTLNDDTRHHTGGNRINVKSLSTIGQILNNAILLDTVVSEPDTNKKSPNTAFLHKFYTLIEYGGQAYIAKTSVEEFYNQGKNGVSRKAYNLKAIKIEPAGGQFRIENSSSSVPGTDSVYSIADLYEFVKTYDKDFTPAHEVSELMLNEDGTPKVFYHGTRKENGEFWEFDYNKAKKKGGLGFKALGQGNYFSASKLDGSELFGPRVIEAYLNIKNPLIVEAGAGFDFRKAVSDTLGINASQMTYPAIQSAMRKHGYDGVVQVDSEGKATIAVTFDSTQIKSATDNIGTFDTENPDIRFQMKKSSNRAILAEALESVAQNDIEKNKLAQYKEKISLIEAEQAKLTETRAKIKELSLAKGARDTATIRNLQDSATRIANRINTYDRQLLNLEATTALKNVLEREKARVRKAEAQKGKEALKAYREKAETELRDTVLRYQESRHKAVEGRRKTEERHAIAKIAKDLDKLLNHGTKERNVKKGASDLVRSALDLANMYFASDDDIITSGIATQMTDAETKLIEKYTALYDEYHSYDDSVTANKVKRAELRSKMNAIRSELSDVLEREKKRINDTTASGIYDTLIKEYKKLSGAEESYLREAFNQDVVEYIEEMRKKVGNNLIGDMTLEQLKDLHRAFTMIKTVVQKSNKLFGEKNRATIAEQGESAIAEIEKQGHKATFSHTGKLASTMSFNNLKPIYLIERTKSKVLQERMQEILDGESIWAVDMEEGRAFLDEAKKKHGYDKWDFDKAYEFETETGLKYSLTLGEIFSIYAYSKRGEQALNHLRVDGFVFDKTKKIKSGKGYEVELNDSTSYAIDDKTRLSILGKLTAEQRAFIDETQKYLSEVMGEKGNEVSREMYGIDLFGEENYFPLRAEGAYLERAREQANGQVKYKNRGFTKATQEGARNPVVLSDYSKVWAEHVAEMSGYHAFTLALENFYKVYNYQNKSSTETNKKGVIPALNNAYGDGITKAIDQLLTDLNGGARSDPRETPFKTGLSLFKKAKTMFSLSVIIQQPSSLLRAQAMIDAKYFVGFSKGKHKEMWNEIKKYAPVAVIKEMGRFDVGMGRSSAEWLLNDKNWREAVDDFLSRGASYADEAAWIKIWNAVKRETLHTEPTLKPNSEEFLKKAGQRFEDIIRHTQVYDSTLSRSGNMRSKSGLMQIVTAFMAEPTTAINMREMALRSGDKKRIIKTTAAVYASTLLNAVLVALPYAMRDDDEDETFIEKYVTALTTSFVDNINPLTSLPFIKDIYSMLQGYDVKRSDMALADDLINSFEKFISAVMDEEKDKDKITSSLLSLFGDLSSFTGLPVDNAIREVKSIVNFVKTLTKDFGGRKTTWLSFTDALQNAFTKETPIVNWVFDEESKADKLYDAIMAGDKAYASRIKGTYKTETSLESAMRKALREHDPRIKEAAEARIGGDIAEYTRIVKEITAEGRFVQDIVVGAINTEINAINKATKEEPEEVEVDEATSIYRADDINAALDSGDTDLAKDIIAELIDVKVENGAEESKARSSVKSSITKHWKKLYKEAYAAKDTAEMRRIREILYATRLYGTAIEVVETVSGWIKEG